MRKLGIDVSEHNGYIDVQKIKNNGIDFMIIRSSWGHFAQDKQLDNNVRKCNEVGMKWGLYHYSYATNNDDARNEVTNFLELSKRYQGRSYPLILDMEDADHWKQGQGVTMHQEIETIRIWKEVIEKSGNYLMLYINRDWWNRLRAIDPQLIDSIDIWLAHWGITEPSIECGMWQFTSDGVVSGSSKRTDMNYCYKDYPSLISKKEPEPVAPVPPKPMYDEYSFANDVWVSNKWGTGETRKQNAILLGLDYDKIQRIIGEIATGKKGTIVNDKMSARDFAIDVWYHGKWGTGETRKQNCIKQGVNYGEVQRLIGLLAQGKNI